MSHDRLVAVPLADLHALIAQASGRWLTIESAARYSDLSPESLRRLIAAGKLTAHRPRKGRILIDRRQLDQYIESTTDARRRSRRA